MLRRNACIQSSGAANLSKLPGLRAASELGDLSDSRPPASSSDCPGLASHANAFGSANDCLLGLDRGSRKRLRAS